MAVGRKIKPYSPLKNIRRQAREQQAEALANLNRYKQEFMNMPTDNLAANYANVFSGAKNVYAGAKNQFSNIQNQFANLENTAEDLRVSTEAANFQRQQMDFIH